MPATPKFLVERSKSERLFGKQQIYRLSVMSVFFQRTAHQSHAQQATLRDLENQSDALRNTLKDAETQAVKVISSLAFSRSVLFPTFQ